MTALPSTGLSSSPSDVHLPPGARSKCSRRPPPVVLGLPLTRTWTAPVSVSRTIEVGPVAFVIRLTTHVPSTFVAVVRAVGLVRIGHRAPELGRRVACPDEVRLVAGTEHEERVDRACPSEATTSVSTDVTVDRRQPDGRHRASRHRQRRGFAVVADAQRDPPNRRPAVGPVSSTRRRPARTPRTVTPCGRTIAWSVPSIARKRVERCRRCGRPARGVGPRGRPGGFASAQYTPRSL